jgi:hypothetical protein
MVMDKMIDILILLEKKTSAMKKRIERIEAGINELYKKKKSEVTEKREATRGRVGPRAFKCTLGRALLKLGLFGLLSSVASLKSEPARRSRNGSRRAERRRNWSRSVELSSGYGGILIQTLIEVTGGIKNKQASETTTDGGYSSAGPYLNVPE